MKNLDLSFYDEKNEFFFFFIKKFISSFYNFKWRENKSIYENVNFFENTDLILIKKKKIQICILKKNRDLVLFK